MPSLPNQRWELYAQALAAGKSNDEAYEAAGYAKNRCNASRLKTNENIRNRVSELQEKAADAVVLNRAWVLDRLMRNVRICMGDEKTRLTVAPKTPEMPPFDIEGFDRDANAANKALQLLGQEVGMFVQKTENTNLNYDLGVLLEEVDGAHGRIPDRLN